MTVKSIQEAWDEVNKIFPYDYEKNETASKNAGYPIYYSTTSDHQIIRIIGFQTLAIVLKSILKMEGQSMCG